MSLFKHERGQGLVEYALILVLTAIVVIAVLMMFGQPLIAFFAALDWGSLFFKSTITLALLATISAVVYFLTRNKNM